MLINRIKFGGLNISIYTPYTLESISEIEVLALSRNIFNSNNLTKKVLII
jgi:hypothetical protein